MTPAISHPCCIPSRSREQQLIASIAASEGRARIRTGSVRNMVLLNGGAFWMGTDQPGSFPADGEGPARAVTLNPFYISTTPVTNREFQTFVTASGYRTEAERTGWSFVFRNHLPAAARRIWAAGAPWWHRVEKAAWHRPFGEGSSTLKDFADLPAVHVSWNDAHAYCEWSGTRLPSEAEWEFAARGGLDRKTFPWGDELVPHGEHMCNVFQGSFPELDLAEDGFSAVAAARSFQPNGFGLFTTVGNTWEWCADYFDANWHALATGYNPVGPPHGTDRVLKGGSYLCHESYCNRYRCAARTSNESSLSTGHIGFRVVRDL